MNNGPIIGTLSDKSTHAFLKRYIEPNKEYHEVPVMGKAFLYRHKFKNVFYLDEFDDFESGVNY